MSDEPMTVADLAVLLDDLPNDAVVQIHDGYYGTDSDLIEWVLIVEADFARLVLGRKDRR